MVDFIVNNYIIIIIVAAFLIFALIGFAVDTTKNKKNKESELLTQPNDETINIEEESVNQEVVQNEEKNGATPDNSEIPEADSVNMNMDN